MRKYMLIGSLAALCCLLYNCDPAHRRQWELVWEDTFSGQSTFDTAVWSKIPRGKSDWNNYMSSFDSCYAVEGGDLILYGIRNTTQHQDTAPYLTGGVYTKGKKTFSDGKIEIRAKLGTATGAWPAIWMLPEDAAWPRGGEIDIMEHLNSDTIVYQTVHSYYTYTLGIKDNPVSGATAAINPKEYNIYGVELNRDSLVFSVNRKRVFAYPRIVTETEGQYPFDKPFYLLIDMQLGGNWVGKVNPDDLPVKMSIDWVRFYKKREIGR